MSQVLKGSIAKEKLLSGNISDLKLICFNAYDLAVQQGFDGTLDEWLDSLKGDSPHIGENGNWWIGDVDTGVQANFESHLGDKTNPHGVTAGQVGAAPAVESTEYHGCFFRTVDEETEWLNPPMELGVEYRTTERYNGKPVYVASFDFGSLPSNSSKYQDVYISGYGVSNSIGGIYYWGETLVDMNLSFCKSGSTYKGVVDGLTGVDFYFEPMNLGFNVTTSKDLSNINLKVTVKYTKQVF